MPHLPHILLTISALMWVGACNKKKVSPSPSQPIAWLEPLTEKHDKYIELSKEVRDDYGFIKNCDSLLFTALGNIGGTAVDLSVAEEINQDGQLTGKWYRTPGHDCWPFHSMSSISKDMLTGLFWESFRHKDLPRLSRVWEYGEKHSWMMGEGDIGAVFLTPQMIAMLAKMIYQLGGTNHKEERFYPHLWPKGLLGYEAHLQVLDILIYHDIDGEITQEMFERLAEHYLLNPHNALFSFAYHLFKDGNYDDAISTLLDEHWFPKDRLPKGYDRCQSYLWQRDQWEYVPCKDNHRDFDKTYDGVDLILVSGLIIKEANRDDVR